MPSTKQPAADRQRNSVINAGSDINDLMTGKTPSKDPVADAHARRRVAYGDKLTATAEGKTAQNLFSDPPRPTGRPPGMTEEDAQPMGETEVSPEEQKQYDQIVRFAAKLIYKNPRETLAAMNFKDLTVHEAVGRHAANLAKVVQETAKAHKTELTPDALWHAGDEVVEMLMDLGVQAKAFELDPESEQYQQEGAMAKMEAAKIYGEEMLKDPKKNQKYSSDAADIWSWNIAKEVDNGEASPEYLQQVEQYRKQNDPITAGVRRALGGQS